MENIELRELLLDKLNLILKTRLLFSEKWGKVQAYIDMDNDMQEEVLVIKWSDPKLEWGSPFNMTTCSVNALPIVVEEHKDKIEKDCPNAEMANLLGEVFKDYADDSDEITD